MCTRRLTRELQSLQKNPIKSPSIRAVPNESNLLEWHYVIEGSAGTPYDCGHYHGKLIFPKEYPLKPPSVIMLTPSGRFKTNRRLCLSMSDFHPETWNPMWSVSTILTGLYSFMIETAPTLGSIESTDSVKRRFARQSLSFNVKDKNFAKLFPDLVEIHNERMQKATHRQITKEKLTSGTSLSGASKFKFGLGGDDNLQQENVSVTIAAGFVALLSVLLAIRIVFV